MNEEHTEYPIIQCPHCGFKQEKGPLKSFCIICKKDLNRDPFPTPSQNTSYSETKSALKEAIQSGQITPAFMKMVEQDMEKKKEEEEFPETFSLQELSYTGYPEPWPKYFKCMGGVGTLLFLITGPWPWVGSLLALLFFLFRAGAL